MMRPVEHSSLGLWTPFELIGATVLAIAAVAGVVAWAAAQLAAIVTGRGPQPFTVADGATALFALPSKLGDPATAWPAGAELPGPAIYWSAFAAVLVAATATGIGGWRLGARLVRPRRPAGVELNVGLARRRDLTTLLVSSPQPGRLTLGNAAGRLVAAEPQASLAVIGPSGCGKTAGLAIPALLEWDGPVICTSVKNDLAAATLTARQQRGTCWVYDPTHAAGPITAAWSPLPACVTWDGAQRVAAWLCEAAQARLDTVTDGDYWYTQARKGLAPYLHAAALDTRTMSDVVRWIDTEHQDDVRIILRRCSGLDVELTARRTATLASGELDSQRTALRAQVIRQLIELWQAAGSPEARLAGTPVHTWPHELQDRVDARVTVELTRRLDTDLDEALQAEWATTGRLDPLIAAEALWRKEDRLRGSVYATMQNAVAAYADPGIAAAGIRNDLDLDEWLSGPNTIYVIAPAHEQSRLRPAFAVLVQQAIRHAYDTANSNGGTLHWPCLALLDEAGNIAPLRDLPTYASTARSHGISLVTIWQDLAQLKAIYAERAQTLLNNHRSKIFGSGIADDATLEYLSRLLGDHQHHETNTSADLTGGRRSVSQHTSYRRLLPMDAVRRLHLFHALLVYGALHPADLSLRPPAAGRSARRGSH